MDLPCLALRYYLISMNYLVSARRHLPNTQSCDKVAGCIRDETVNSTINEPQQIIDCTVFTPQKLAWNGKNDNV